MAAEDEYEGGPDQLEEKMAALDEGLADQRAATLRASLSDYDLDEDDTELLGGEGSVQFGEPPAGVTEVEAGAVLVFDVPLPKAGAFAIPTSTTTARRFSFPIARVVRRPTISTKSTSTAAACGN